MKAYLIIATTMLTTTVWASSPFEAGKIARKEGIQIYRIQEM